MVAADRALAVDAHEKGRHEIESNRPGPPHASWPRSLRQDATKKKRGGPPNHDQGRRQSLRSIAAPQINLHEVALTPMHKMHYKQLSSDRELRETKRPNPRATHAIGCDRAIYDAVVSLPNDSRTSSHNGEERWLSKSLNCFLTTDTLCRVRTDCQATLARVFLFGRFYFLSGRPHMNTTQTDRHCAMWARGAVLTMN